MKIPAFALIALALIVSISMSTAEGNESCRSLDTREFGLVSDGEISEPWSEIKLIEAYGPPCQIINLGEVFFQTNNERIREIGPRTRDTQRGTFATKEQFVYKGDYSNPTSVFTIVDGVVVKKERVR